MFQNVSSVQLLSRVSLQPDGLQHTRLPCPSPTFRACSNSCPSRQWCHPPISSSVSPSSSCLQSFPASGSFPRSKFFASGGQSTGASASVSVLSLNTQGWFHLGLTGLISVQSITLYYFALTRFSDTALKALTYVSSCNVLNNLKKFIQRYQVPLLITET